MAESDDEFIQTPSVGDRLKAARETKKLSLEDIADQTRIPLRHLQNLESGDWTALPAPTYTIGFAKSYASAVGLDRTEIGEDLRAEMGGQRFDTSNPEVFEPADPARTMPKWLVLSAIGAIVLLVLVMTWLNNRSLAPDEPAAPAQQEASTTPAQQSAPATPTEPQKPQQAASGPVVLTAAEPAWIRVTDQGKTLFEGVLAAGQTYAVPQTATAPLLRAGAPEALRINVGSAVAPPVGPAGKVASNVSLRPEDLMKGGAADATVPAPSAPPAVRNTTG
ncbi:MAG TPA: RodZ domain-containing protein [Sphingomicrobium sp.]|nr:RodZ domain-containing protein [Sphingomicrobium sp.]